ncbi:MAG: dihydrolipoyl dehydrogenase [Candidatus Saliniplasma sp.]
MSSDVIVIGSGPGGYKSAVHAAERGFDVKLIEKSRDIGGVCTNQGCIPSKALLSIAERVDAIKGARRKGISANLDEIDLKKGQKVKDRAVQTSRKGILKQLEENDVEIIKGEAKINNDKVVEVDEREFEAEHIIIATGSEPIVLPDLNVDEQNILTSKGALELDEIPESMVVIGGGYVGIELAFVFSSFGSKVTIVELMDSILPNMDRDLVKEIEKVLKRKRIKMITGSKVSQVNGNSPYEVVIEGETEKTIKTEKILCAVGRKPTPPEMNLDIIGDRGEIITNDYMETSIEGIYAVGDVTGKSMLAHSAYKHGEIAVKMIDGEKTDGFSHYEVPAGVYTHPEAASVGLTEKAAEKKFNEIKVGKYPISASGRGYSTGNRTGIAKIVASDNKIVGIHLVCPGATDIIMEGTVAMEAGITLEELSDIIHPHPTYSEALKKAAEIAIAVDSP